MKPWQGASGKFRTRVSRRSDLHIRFVEGLFGVPHLRRLSPLADLACPLRQATGVPIQPRDVLSSPKSLLPVQSGARTPINSER